MEVRLVQNKNRIEVHVLFRFPLRLTAREVYVTIEAGCSVGGTWKRTMLVGIGAMKVVGTVEASLFGYKPCRVWAVASAGNVRTEECGIYYGPVPMQVRNIRVTGGRIEWEPPLGVQEPRILEYIVRCGSDEVRTDRCWVNVAEPVTSVRAVNLNGEGE